jgi:hypothetical protein
MVFLPTVDSVDRRYLMLATALGQLRAKDVENALRLYKKVRSGFHDEAARVTCPHPDQPVVDK